MYTEEEKRQAIADMVESLDKLPYGDVMMAYGFFLCLKANQPAA